MKKYYIRIILFFIFTAALPAEEVVRITNGEFPPFMSEDLPRYGLYSDIVSEAFKAVGIKVEYAFFPWTRAFLTAEEGLYDASIGWIKTPEREEAFIYSLPIGKNCAVFFHLKTTAFKWERPEDLEGFRIGITNGDITETQLNELRESGINIEMQSASGIEMNFKKLLAGRIDLFLAGNYSAMYILRKYFSEYDADRIEINENPFWCDYFHVIFSIKNEKSLFYKNKLDEGLEIIMNNGRYYRLFDDFRNGVYD